MSVFVGSGGGIDYPAFLFTVNLTDSEEGPLYFWLSAV